VAEEGQENGFLRIPVTASFLSSLVRCRDAQGTLAGPHRSGSLGASPRCQVSITHPEGSLGYLALSKQESTSAIHLLIAENPK
jgi:hypothetical protein